MKFICLMGIMLLHLPQEGDLDRILRQFKQSRTQARSDKDYLAAIHQAREALENYLRKNPEAPDAAKAFWHHTETYLYSMEFQTAVEGFDKFVRTYPKNPRVSSAKLAAAELCMRLERDAEARKRLEAWKSNYPKDDRVFQVRIFLAALLIFEKKFEESIAALEKLRADFRGKPKEWSAAMQLAACLHLAEKNTRAKKILEEIATSSSEKNLAGTAQQFLREYSRLGKTLPSRKETDKEGKTLHLGKHAGKVIVFYFFTSRLPITESEVEFLQKTHEQFSGKDLVIIGVCIDPVKRDFLAFQAAFNVPWTIFYDGNGLNGYLARLYGVHGIPTLRVLDRNGRIRFYNVSGRDLRIAVEKLLDESE